MTIKTILHCQMFHLREPGGMAAYDALTVQLAAAGMTHQRMEVLGTPSYVKGAMEHRDALRKLDGKEVELQVDWLTDNQWNTPPIEGISESGLRVFDWQDSHLPGVEHVRTVQWLEQTEEMRKVRREYLKCGYCGAMYYLPDQTFCNHCLDSEYLKPGELFLLRLVPAGESSRDSRPPLTEAEQAGLLPRYRDAQLHGSSERGKARIAKLRADVATKYAAAVRHAEVERDGMTWLLDHLPGMTGNAIYYKHTGRWGFGWRTKLDEALLGELLDAITEFPFPYDIDCADGRRLSGER